VAQEDVGYVGPSAYYYIASSSGTTPTKVFDGDPTTVYDGYGGGVNLQLLYVAHKPFLLTDYQLLWYTSSSECPSKWRLYGQEETSGSWELVDTMLGPRTEPATYKFMNRTVDNPGYYTSYKFIFSEWAPVNGASVDTSDGHVLRDIILNPNGFATHYGSAPARLEAIDDRVALGFTNLAYGKPVYQVGGTTTNKTSVSSFALLIPHYYYYYYFKNPIP
jgi:hypothetical protein